MRSILSPFLFAAVIGAPALAEVGICPISADFVTEPETRETTEQVGSVAVRNTTMRAFVDGAMVQIECTGVSPDQVFPGQDDATVLANYVRFWSIEPTGPAYRDGDTFAIEGTKDIQGIEVTYTYRLFRFANSFAMVATGVPGGGQPPDVERFLSSIEVTSASFTQELHEIVRDQEYLDVRNALERQQWSKHDLSKALVAAAGLNRPAVTRILLESGADPDFKILGSSVIVTAVRENSAATLDLILESGGDPNQRVSYDWTPLHHAILADGVRFQSLRILLEHGAEIDARTSLQVTPLHRAAGFCLAKAVEALLDAGADTSLTEKYGRTAYQRSVAAGCPGTGGLSAL